MNNKNFSFLLASLLFITTMAGCKGEKASAAEKVKDSVTSPSLIADSVVKKKDVPLVVDSIGKSYSTKKGDVDLAYSFPVSGPQPLVDSLRAYLSSELVWIGDDYSDEGVESKPYSNIADGKHGENRPAVEDQTQGRNKQDQRHPSLYYKTYQ